MRLSARILAGIRERCGDDFIVGLAVNVDPEAEASLSLAELAEIVRWHDERRLMDYVTCGTGSYFDFHKIMPTSLYEQRPRRPVRRRAQACRHARPGPGREPHPDARGRRGGPRRRPGGHGQHRARPDRRSASRRQGAGRATARRCGPCISCNQLCWGRRSRDYWISCLVNPSAGRELEWGGDRFEPAADATIRAGRRRRPGRPGGRAGRRRTWPSRDARRSVRRGSAASSGWPASSRRAGRSRTCSPGTAENSSGSTSTSGSASRWTPPRSRPSAQTRSSWRPGPVPRSPASSAPCPWWIGCQVSGTHRRSGPSRRSWTGRSSRAAGCSSSTTWATGAASGPRSISPSAATT